MGGVGRKELSKKRRERGGGFVFRRWGRAEFFFAALALKTRRRPLNLNLKTTTTTTEPVTLPAGTSLNDSIDFLLELLFAPDVPKPRRLGAAVGLASLAKSSDNNAADGDEAAAVAAAVALLTSGLFETLAAAASTSEPSAAKREGAFLAVAELAKATGGEKKKAPDAAAAAPSTPRTAAAASSASSSALRCLEPSLAPFLQRALDASADKSPDARTAAADAASALAAQGLHQAAFGADSPFGLLHPLLASADPAKAWQEKAAAISALRKALLRNPRAATNRLPLIVPLLTSTMCDARKEVQAASAKLGPEALALVGNRDLEPAVPAILDAMAHPDRVVDCVGVVASTTFVQPVEAPALAVLVPLLLRGLRTKNTPAIRKTAKITANMAKLVFSPGDAEAFFPTLLPLLEKAADETANPECREVVEDAVTALRAAADAAGAAPAEKLWPESDSRACVRECIEKASASASAAAANGGEATGNGNGAPAPAPSLLPLSSSLADAAIAYAAALGRALAADKIFSPLSWTDAVAPLLRPFVPSAEAAVAAAKACAHAAKAATHVPGDGASESDDDGDDEEAHGPPLCDCEFSLAYGGKILLSSARLKLRPGARYGLCGANGVGKSTLLRAIADGKVEGFPARSELRTAYVESNIDAEADCGVAQYVYEHPELVAEGEEHRPTVDDVDRVLEQIGFDAAGRAAPVASLSGGWKMKLAIARAMLLKAQLLLLDEPTNHLDVANVKWLEEFLTGRAEKEAAERANGNGEASTSTPPTTPTALIVSHDANFLDSVCTHVIHYHRQRLDVHRGNLTAFVAAYPPARAFLDLEATTAEKPFAFPTPGILVGVSSRDRAILKIREASFTYPGAPLPQLSDINIWVTLSSRIAVLGANGAGKSTLIKLLTGETVPDSGTVWAHPNLRVAYVAQHTFHHLEKHLDTTPLAYLQWRYGSGEDREGLEKAARQASEEEKALMLRAIPVAENGQGETRVVEALCGRRKLKNSFEYEVKWVDFHRKHNSWIPRERLEELGFSKAIAEVDVAEATRQGLLGPGAKEFTSSVIISHLGDFGLDEEFAQHSHIRGLSGGQKVKVVLAAACWNCPHVVILDEPTNFLDRESCSSLAAGLDAFGGGVVIISHNSEFTSQVCDEVWTVADRKVAVERKGAAAARAAAEEGKSSTVSVFLPRNRSGKDLVLEGADLDAAILEAAQLKEAKKEAARLKKIEKEEAKKIRFSRRT